MDGTSTAEPESLNDLHAAVVRYIERCGVKLAEPSVWSYPEATDVPYLDEIVCELEELLEAESRMCAPVGGDCRALAKQAEMALDAFLPSLAPVLEFVDLCAMARPQPGADVSPRALARIQESAPRIHRLAEQAAEMRLGLIELREMLEPFVPSDAKLGVGEFSRKTLYA